MEILTIEDKQALDKALQDANILKVEIEKAKRAGLDVSTLEVSLRQAIEQITAIQRVYFPNRRRG